MKNKKLMLKNFELTKAEYLYYAVIKVIKNFIFYPLFLLHIPIC